MRKLKQKLGTLLSGVKRNGKLDLLAILMLLGRMKIKNIREKTLYKIKTCCIPLLILCALSSAWSCSDDQKGYNNSIDNKFTKVIYQKSTNDIDFDLYRVHKSTDHLVKVEHIKPESIEGTNLLKIAHNVPFILNDRSIKKFSFDNTDVIMISIEADQKNKKLILYKRIGEIKFAYVSSSKENSIKKISLFDMNNVLLYSCNVNNLEKVGDFQFGQGNINVNRLLVHTDSDLTNLSNLKLQKNGDSCPETTRTFSECMGCALDECSDDWVCVVALAVFPEEMVAAYGISCLFADNFSS